MSEVFLRSKRSLCLFFGKEMDYCQQEDFLLTEEEYYCHSLKSSFPKWIPDTTTQSQVSSRITHGERMGWKMSRMICIVKAGVLLWTSISAVCPVLTLYATSATRTACPYRPCPGDSYTNTSPGATCWISFGFISRLKDVVFEQSNTFVR